LHTFYTELDFGLAQSLQLGYYTFSGILPGRLGTPAHLLKSPAEKDVRSSHYPVYPLVEKSSDLVLEHLEEKYLLNNKKILIKSAFFMPKSNLVLLGPNLVRFHPDLSD